MKEKLALFKWWEWLFLALSFAVLLALGLIFNSSWIIILNALLGISAAFLMSKGVNLGNVLALFQVALYIYLAWTNAYYGEVISCFIFAVPTYVASIITWAKHNQKGQVKVRPTIGWKEWLISSAVCVVIGVGIFFVLRAFNTANLILSSVLFTFGCIRGYLMIRRSEYNFIISCITRIMNFALWFSLVIGGRLSYIPTSVTYLLYLVIDIYGTFYWLKLKRKQKEELQENL